MHWQLWHIASGSLVETFDTETEALHGVRDMLAVNSPDLIDELAVGAMYDEGESREAGLPPVLDGEALKSRLADTAQASAADAAREVHERIRRWLAEEHWDIREIPDPRSSFNVVATLPSGPDVNIFQYTHHLDRITFSQHWIFDDELRSAISQFPAGILREVVWDIYRDVSIMGVEFQGLDTPSAEMTLRTYLYFDGLTKDTFVQRALLTIRALAMAIRTFFRALEEHGTSADTASRLLHLVPPTEGPLTVAS